MAACQKLRRNLILAPLEDYSGRNARSIFILSTDEPTKPASDDPLIKAGRRVPEFMKWFVEKGSLS